MFYDYRPAGKGKFRAIPPGKILGLGIDSEMDSGSIFPHDLMSAASEYSK